jgi:hypothetical protein
MRRLHLGLLVGVIVVVLAVSGLLYVGASCATTMVWDLEVGVYETEVVENGSFVFRGGVSQGGSTGQPRIENVTVVFLDANESRLASVPIGDFGVDAQRARNLTVTLPERPARVELQTERIEADRDTKWFIVGLEWTGERYEDVTLRSNPEPWYC